MSQITNKFNGECLKTIELGSIPLRLKRKESIYFLAGVKNKIQFLRIILTNYRIFISLNNGNYDVREEDNIERFISLNTPAQVTEGIKAYSLQSIIAVDPPQFQKKVDYEKGYWYFLFHYSNGKTVMVKGCRKKDIFYLNLILIELIDRLNDPIDETVFKPRRESISEEIKITVWRRDKGQCVKCGSRVDLEYDHIIPVSKGGANTVRNIELLCEKCNRKKSNKIM